MALQEPYMGSPLSLSGVRESPGMCGVPVDKSGGEGYSKSGFKP
jgi:hypothetical protein